MILTLPDMTRHCLTRRAVLSAIGPATAEAAPAKADLLVESAGGARHYSGMAQKINDEARRPPGTGSYVNRRSLSSGIAEHEGVAFV